MVKKIAFELDSLADPEQAKETVMLEYLWQKAKTFFSVQDNIQAFKAWKEKKEAQKDGGF